ncbi:MAG: prolyl oligopeptidase family serine peptidase [Bacteroidetes bacterium]|nr:prolyl oligopeptidase family serine peptidase [Bacteroidota bacterium]
MKRFPLLLLKILLPVIAVAVIAYVYLYTADLQGYFQERRGILTQATVDPIGPDTFFDKSWLRLENRDGFNVLCGMLVPKKVPGFRADRDSAQTVEIRTQAPVEKRYPAIILLGGKATGKYAVDYALGIQDVIIVAPDYPYEPRSSYSLVEFALDLPEMRQAIIDMIPSVMLIIDYLWQRPDVDTSKIVILGYSFGAPFVPCILAHDRRAAVAAMVYGGGDMGSLIRHNVARYEGAVVSEFVGQVCGLLLRPLEPLRFVDNISPIPLVMINGAHDEQVPRENTLMLYRAARQPKKLIWIESRHVHPKNVELTRRIIQTLKAELVNFNILPRFPSP